MILIKLTSYRLRYSEVGKKLIIKGKLSAAMAIQPKILGWVTNHIPKLATPLARYLVLLTACKP